MTIDRMDRLRELRTLRRSVAERDAERARSVRTEFEGRVTAARKAHERMVSEASTRRRTAVDALMAEPSGPLGIARMANVHAVIDGEVADAAAEEDAAREGLADAERDVEEAQDVLAAFIRKESAMDAALERLEGDERRVEEDAEEDEGT